MNLSRFRFLLLRIPLILARILDNYIFLGKFCSFSMEFWFFLNQSRLKSISIFWPFERWYDRLYDYLTMTFSKKLALRFLRKSTSTFTPSTPKVDYSKADLSRSKVVYGSGKPHILHLNPNNRWRQVSCREKCWI